MTSDVSRNVSRNDTKAAVPEGRYEQKRQDDLTRGQVARQTDERISGDRRGHTVRINTGSSCTIRVVKVALDVNAQNHKEAIAHLNERLRRLRCR
jgi:hypothetical protein